MHIARRGSPLAGYFAGRAALVVAALLALTAASFDAKAAPARSALVIDANTGAVLHALAADAPRFPASLTKMMTLYLAFEQIEQGNLSYGTKIKISQEAAMASPSKLDLDPGEEIALIDAIKALITKSANDVAVAVAEHISGSETNFARLMTAKARQLGMPNTTFRNASGLPDPGQTTTARDMLTLALRLQDDFPRQYPLFATRAFTYDGETYKNHNTLLASLAGTDGIKTGYTRASGFNVVTSVKRDGKHVIGVIFGGASAAKRNAEMRQLINRVLPRASTRKTRKPAVVASPRPVTRPDAKALTAARPEPALKTSPKLAARPAPEPPPARSAEAEVAPAAPAGTSPAIHITKVRRVMVAPRAAARPEETTDEAAPAAEQQPASRPLARTVAAAPAADAPLTRSLTAAPGRPPSTLDQQLEALLANGAPAPAPADGPALVAVSRPAGPGRPPSTLAEQARMTTRGANSAEPRLQQGDAPPSAGAFHIQVGAYGSAEDAERQIVLVRQNAGPLLQGRSPVTLPVRKGTRQLYRARFAGFDANAAAAACLELRRRQIDCFVMRAE